MTSFDKISEALWALDSIDDLYLALALRAEHTLLPELYEVFGLDVVKFLQVFGGMTIKVPKVDLLLEILRDVEIYRRLKETKDRDSEEKFLARKHNLCIENVRVIFRNMESMRSALEGSLRGS